MAEADPHDDVIVVGSGLGGSVATHAYGSAKLLHHMAHKGKLTGLSDQLGQRARTNSEQLLSITRSYGEWKHVRE
jgi:hypothetical protein